MVKFIVSRDNIESARRPKSHYKLYSCRDLFLRPEMKTGLSRGWYPRVTSGIDAPYQAPGFRARSWGVSASRQRTDCCPMIFGSRRPARELTRSGACSPLVVRWVWSWGYDQGNSIAPSWNHEWLPSIQRPTCWEDGSNCAPCPILLTRGSQHRTPAKGSHFVTEKFPTSRMHRERGGDWNADSLLCVLTLKASHRSSSIQ